MYGELIVRQVPSGYEVIFISSTGKEYFVVIGNAWLQRYDRVPVYLKVDISIKRQMETKLLVSVDGNYYRIFVDSQWIESQWERAKIIIEREKLAEAVLALREFV
jgi:hypothetical protein